LRLILDRMHAHDIRRVAVEAPADPRTINAYLRGENVTPMARTRIERALRNLGFGALVRPAPVSIFASAAAPSTPKDAA
jgi:hypothetical protein